MKITRENLLESDFDTLFTRDPGTFIEAIIINLMWAKGNESEATIIARQRYIFERWLEFYSGNVRELMAAELTNNPAAALQKLARDKENERRGFLRGRIYALSNLPIKKSVLTSYVDLIEVARILRQLKSENESPKP